MAPPCPYQAPNFVLNTVVGRELKEFADELEGSKDFNADLHKLIVKTIKSMRGFSSTETDMTAHGLRKPKKRGLCNLKTTPDCLPYFLSDKNVSLFTESGVLSKTEIESRYDITLEAYCKVIGIEAATMLDMAKKTFSPRSRHTAGISPTPP